MNAAFPALARMLGASNANSFLDMARFGNFSPDEVEIFLENLGVDVGWARLIARRYKLMVYEGGCQTTKRVIGHLRVA